MRVAVLGAGGLLGRALCSSVPADRELVAWHRRDVDIRDTAELARRMRDARPDWVLNAAAYTDVDGAERDRDTAYAVNATAVGELARIARAQGAAVLHVSTDYVFAGNRDACYAEDDPVAPVNAYGASKEAGERLLRESGARHVIVRTQWVFGAGGRSFLSTVLDRARRRDAIRVVADEYGCCTYAGDLAATIWTLLGTEEGVFHVANRGRVSRYDVARHIYAAVGAADCVAAMSTAELAVAAARPTSSLLCVDKVERATGRAMPHWTDAVRRYLESQGA